MTRHNFWIALLICANLAIRTAQTLAQPVTLDQAVEYALLHNPELHRWDEEVKAARASWWQSISPEDPALFTEFKGVLRGDPWSQYRERATGISQHLDFPTAYIFRGQRQSAEIRHLIANAEQHKNAIIAAVKKQFFQLLLINHQIMLYENIKLITTQNFHHARIRVLSGEATAYDTLKVNVDLAETENRIMTLKYTHDVVRSELAVLMGHDRDNLVDVIGSLEAPPAAPDLEALQQIALKRHPRLLAADADWRQKQAESRLAWSNLLPTIEVKCFKVDLPYALPNQNAWGGGLSLSVPFWFLMKGQGSIRSAAHQQRAAQWGIEAEERQVLLDIEKAFAHYLSASKQVEKYQKRTLTEVEELIRIASRSYEVGELGYLELSESLKTYDRVKAGYFEALYAVRAAEADLENAAGAPLSPQ